jgi:surface protein
MDNMFAWCHNLNSLNVSSFNTSKVQSMESMFRCCCENLTELDLSSFNTSNVNDMSEMFQECRNLKKLDLSSFNTSNVWDMRWMFGDCHELSELNLSSFDTANAEDMRWMFQSCDSLTELDLSSFDTSNVEYLRYFINGCPSLEVLKTPKKNGQTTPLPDVMYDAYGKEYTDLPVRSGSITLTREKPTVTPTPTPTPAPAAGFSDVKDPKHAYYNAIYWAADAGITKGYPDGTFGIDKSCTRGEMMMFLWRYAGKPAPKAVSKSPFKDVAKTHAFYNAILWGSQNGITKGYSDGTFGLDRNVSRGECMMFLWRLKGKPAPKAVATSPFKDVPKTNAFYNAILWGAQKKVTTGYTSGPKKGTFGINENCTRGQIVTFLYRAK